MAEKMVEKVMRIMGNKKNIRNICTSAHIDHGKTTFSDNLLYGAGMMSEALAGKACLLDFHEDEQARGITIDAANVSMVHECEGQEYLINLIDTPGHVDFGGDVTRAMRACDGTIVLCCAVEGVMPQTETVLRQALRERVKPVLFINKVDRLIKELQLTPEAMQERFIKIIEFVNRLIKQIAEEEYGEKWAINVNEGSVAFGSAAHKWALSVPYMKKTGITFKDVIEVYSKGGDEASVKALAQKAPLHKVILDMSIKHHPNPMDAQRYRIPKIWKGEIEGTQGQALVNCDEKGPLAFVVTKIVVDPHAGEVSAGRLFSGTVKKGDTVYMNRAKQNVRIQQVSIYNGAKRELIDAAPSGNIIGVVGLKDCLPGETITAEPSTPFEQITYIFEPVVTKAIEAKNPADLPKLVEVLRQVHKEDPTIKIEINEETGEHLMHGMGELHLEVIENRIRTEKKVDVQTSPPIVVYRETIVGTTPQAAEGKSPNKHNKFYFTVEPVDEKITESIKKGDIPNARLKKKEQELWEVLEKAGMKTIESRAVREVYNGNLLLDKTKGEVHIGEVIELVMDGFEQVMEKGSLAREPCMKVKVNLLDIKLHEDAIHRGPAQVLPAVRDGIRDAIFNAKPLMLEPVQVLDFEAPIDFMGNVSKLIQNKRGQLLDAQQEGEMIKIKAKMPVAEMFGMTSELRSATEGRATFFLVDQSFERLPDELQGKIIQQIRKRKGLTENQ
jgi:elongation factor 2